MNRPTEKAIDKYRYSVVMLIEHAMDNIRGGDMREVSMMHNEYGGLYLFPENEIRKGDTVVYKFKNPSRVAEMFEEVNRDSAQGLMKEIMRKRAWGRRKEDFYNSLFEAFNAPANDGLGYFRELKPAYEKTRVFLSQLAEEAERSIVRHWCWRKQRELTARVDEIIVAYLKKQEKKKRGEAEC